MNSKTISQGILQAIAVLVGISGLLYFLWAIQSVIVYIIIAAVLSLIARPMTIFLRTKLKFPNTVAVVVTMIFFIGLLSGLIRMFIPLISQQGANLSLLNFNELMNDTEKITYHLNEYFLAYNINIIEEFKNLDLVSKFKELPVLLNSIISTAGSLSIGLFSVLFITFFFLKDSQIMHNSILIIVPDKNEKRVEKSLNTIKDLLSRYFLGLVFQISILFIIYSISLSVLGIENAIVIAFLCALLNLIPYIGPLIACALMVFLTMTSNLGQDFRTEILPTTIWVLIWYVFAQLIDNFFSQPLIFSKSVKSHPLEIFLIIIIGGLLFGVVGMVLAVPAYTVLKVILKEFLADNKIVQSLTKNI
ncbi:AI-2E family transporter [Urechidicola vernalis]|uniref:AI-2E family transporter n=1 Tax=Urechidicola vernalis TaxID=3075600 RepID=A0ABU2Y813_9FLAO|nr:AI-2E family transporter [Urechidicola sp. P050]MDT0554330.1 AI-2E family transporter [Urechidicola sp. P050]